VYALFAINNLVLGEKIIAYLSCMPKMIKTRGIVFRYQKYGDSSVIVDIYTEEKGLQSYIVSGVRSKRARVRASLLQVMSLVDLVAYAREDRELNRIREIRPAAVYESIPFDLRKGAVGLFMVEIARKAIREVEENRRLFAFLYDSFLDLDQTSHPVANWHLSFLVHLTPFLGFLPSGTANEETPFFDLQEGVFDTSIPSHPHYLEGQESFLLSRLLETDRQLAYQISMDHDTRRKLLLHLIDFYRLHIEHFPTIQAHRILEEVLRGGS
jgi:DNA repair protein RecO (recombination protein O)